MDEIKEPVDEESTGNLQEQLNTAREEIENLTQQLNCLLVLTKKAWRGDESATLHLARVIGIDAESEQNEFTEKKIMGHISSGKKSVKILDNDEVLSKQTPSIASTTSQETLPEQRQTPPPSTLRNSYLQPFLKQSQIDPIRDQDSARIFSNMLRYHRNETRKSPVVPNRNTPTTVRPRATKHLYRPASAEHVVRHLGSPISRPKPFFVFAGKDFFQQATSYSPLYQKAVASTGGSRLSNHSDLTDESDVAPSQTVEPVIARPQTAKSTQQSSTLRNSSSRPTPINGPPRASSALSNASSTRLSQMSERDRRDTLRLQRQLNLPRQGWVNQYS